MGLITDAKDERLQCLGWYELVDKDVIAYSLQALLGTHDTLLEMYALARTRLALAERVMEYHGCKTCGCPACQVLRAYEKG